MYEPSAPETAVIATEDETKDAQLVAEHGRLLHQLQESLWKDESVLAGRPPEFRETADRLLSVIAEAAVLAAREYGLPDGCFDIKADPEIRMPRVRVVGENYSYTQAQMRPVRYDFFSIGLNRDEILNAVATLKSPSDQAIFLLQDFINSVGHEVYHGYQFLNDLPEFDEIPDSKVDFKKYWNSKGEKAARAHGKQLVHKMTDDESPVYGFLIGKRNTILIGH